MFRTFVGIRVPPTPALRQLRADLEEIGRPVRAEQEDKWHLTLKFLGDTDAELISAVAQILSEVAAGYDEFLIDLHGLGVFPDLRRPSVVWVGIRTEGPLAEMAAGVEQRLAELGFPPERRKFHAHLTVARIKGRAPRELVSYVTENEDRDYGSHVVESLELYQSELSPHGARYTVMASAVLG